MDELNTEAFTHWRYYGGGGGGRTPPQPARGAERWGVRPGRGADAGGRYAMLTFSTRPQLASKVRIDQTFFVTQDREKSTHPVEGAA